MRRSSWSLAATLAIVALSPPPPAGADAVDVYTRLAARHLSPAPLVPIKAPRAVWSVDASAELVPAARGGYGLRVSGPGAAIVVTGGGYRSLRAALRAPGSNHTVRGTRVRGHRGYLLTRRGATGYRTLLWAEGGAVYSVSGSPPRKVSVAALRAFAAGLERLGPDWYGNAAGGEAEAFAVLTARTISIDVTYDATCTEAGYPGTQPRAGGVKARFLPTDGRTFSFDVASHRTDPSQPWTGTVTGTITPSGITVDVHASGTPEDFTCDTGDERITLDHHSPARP